MSDNRSLIQFLPDVYRTPIIKNLFKSSIDNYFSSGDTDPLFGFIGNYPSYYKKDFDIYIPYFSAKEKILQLKPVVYSYDKENENESTEFLTLFYDDLVNEVSYNGGITKDHNKLFETDSYSWSPPIDLDKFINYKEYYWVPQGPSPKWAGYPVYEYTTDGVKNEFSFSIPYVNPQDVIVFLDGDELVYNVDYTVQGRTVVFSVPPLSDKKLRIVVYKIIGYKDYYAEEGQTRFVCPENLLDENKARVFLNNVLQSQNNGYIIQKNSETGLFEVVFNQPFIPGTRVEIVVNKILNVLQDIQGKEKEYDINGYYYTSNQKIVFPYWVYPSWYYKGEWIVEGVGREIRLFFDKFYSGRTEEELYGWDNFLWDLLPWDFDSNFILYYLNTIINNFINPNIIQVIEYYINFYNENSYTNIDWANSPWDSNIDLLLHIVRCAARNYGFQYNYSTWDPAILPYGSNVVIFFTDINSDQVGWDNFSWSTLPWDYSFDSSILSYSWDDFPWDSFSWDGFVLKPVSPDFWFSHLLNINSWDISLLELGFFQAPLQHFEPPEYVTIERTSIDNNPWSRSNRWFHKSVLSENEIKETQRAKRPIIEFERDIELYNYGRNFRGYVDIIIDDLVDPLFSLQNITQQIKHVPYSVIGVQLNNAGSGYANGTYICTINGGVPLNNDPQKSAKLSVTVINGVVDSVFIVESGEYTTLPTNPVTVTGLVGGFGAQFNLAWIEKGTKLVIKSTSWDFSSYGISEVFYDGVQLKDGMRVLVKNSKNSGLNNYLFKIGGISTHQTISLVQETINGIHPTNPIKGDILSVKSGSNCGKEIHFDGTNWIFSQQRKFNVEPLFNLYDSNPVDDNFGVALDDPVRYKNSNFNGNKIFSYEKGSGKEDPILKKKIKYSKNGEILFRFNLATDRYKDINGEIKGFYFYKIFGKTEENDLYYNGWYRIPEKKIQKYYNIFKIEKKSDVLEMPCLYRKILQVIVDGKILQKNEYDYFLDLNHEKSTIVFNKTYPENTIVEIYSEFCPLRSSIGYFEPPIALMKNTDHREPGLCSRANFDEHFTEILQKNLETVTWVNEENRGNRFTSNVYKDSKKDKTFGSFILQNDHSILRTALLFSDKKLNIFSSLRYVQKEWNKFYNRFIQKIDEFSIQGILSSFDPPGLWVEKILEDLKKFKTDKMPFYTSEVISERSFIPPSTSYLGLTPLYKPEIFVDDTFNEPIKYLLCHDGSMFSLYDDYRDSILLELENKIYDSVKSRYKQEDFPLLSFYDVLPGKWRKTDYSYSEISNILAQGFEIWCAKNNISYRNNTTFTPENKFSWNYYDAISIFGDRLKGSWRAIYNFYYDTDSPHLRPWEMLGFSQKPSWWENEYGLPPYTSYNLKLWKDLRDGRIRHGKRKGIDKRFARPDLLKIIPVDKNGKLLDPYEAGIIDPNSPPPDPQKEWVFGDYSPTEVAWRRSKWYPWEILRTLLLTKPNVTVEELWDTLHYKKIYYRSPSTLQKIDSYYGRREHHKNLKVFGEKDFTGLGLQTLIVHFLEKDGLEPFVFGTKVRNLTTKIGYKFNGFVDNNNFYIRSESYGFLINDDYKIKLYKTSPEKDFFYSGIIIRNIGKNQFQVFGYNILDPNFYLSVGSETGKKKKISYSIGTIVSPRDWMPRTEYIEGDLVVHNNLLYVAIRSHVSSLKFENDIKNWREHANRQETYQISVEKKLEKPGNEIISIVPYGTIINGLQELADFIFDYERFLIDNGWIFDRLVEDSITGQRIVQDFELSMRDVLAWIATDPPPNSTIVVSPFSIGAKFKQNFGVVDDVSKTNIDRYNIVNRSGIIIPANEISFSRVGDFFEAVVKNPSEENNIYGLRVNKISWQHALFISPVTTFDEVIYDDLYSQKQNRLEIYTFITRNWKGKLEAPGYILLENTIVPNFDTSAENFRKFYSHPDLVRDNKLRSYALHNISYESRDYLDNLVLTNTSKLDFYRGMIREKGTVEAVYKILKSNFVASDIDFKIYENWAFRMGEFGNQEQKYEIEFYVPFSLKKNTTQLYKFNVLDRNNWANLLLSGTNLDDLEVYGPLLQDISLDVKDDNIISLYDFYNFRYRLQNDSVFQPSVENGGEGFKPDYNYIVYYKNNFTSVPAKLLLKTNSSGSVDQVLVLDPGDFYSIKTLFPFFIDENSLVFDKDESRGTNLLIKIKFEQKTEDFLAIRDKLWSKRPERKIPFITEHYNPNGGFKYIKTNIFDQSQNSDLKIVEKNTLEEVLNPIPYSSGEFFDQLEGGVTSLFGFDPPLISNPGEYAYIINSGGSTEGLQNQYNGDYTIISVVDSNRKAHSVQASDSNSLCPVILNNQLIPEYAFYIGDGVTTQFAIPFFFDDVSRIAVLINGNIVTSGYTIILGSTNFVSFAVAPTNLSRIEIVKNNIWVYLTDSPFRGWTKTKAIGKLNFKGFVNVSDGNLPPINTVNNGDYYVMCTAISCYFLQNLGQNYFPGDILELIGPPLVPGGNNARFRVEQVFDQRIDNTSISIVSSGSGYPPNTTFQAVELIGGNANVVALVDVTTNSFGGVSSVVMHGNSYGAYQSPPPGNIFTLNLTPGTGAQVSIPLVPYYYADTITLVNAGTGYDVGEILEIQISPQFALENIRIVVDEVNFLGAITKFTIASRGQFIPGTTLPPYSSTVLFSNFSNGSGATFNVTFSNNPRAIRGISIIYGGEYLSVNDTLTYNLIGGSGSGATIKVEGKNRGEIGGYDGVVEAGQWIAKLSNIWQLVPPNQVDYLLFEADNVNPLYYDPNILPGIQPFDVYLLQENRYQNISILNQYIPSPTPGTIVYLDNIPGNNGNNISGIVIYDGSNWNVLSQEEKRPKHSIYISGYLIDKKKEIKVSDVEYFDPLNGRLLSEVRKNINYIIDFDPAFYQNENENGDFWGRLHEGEVWWNIKNYVLIDYHDGNTEFKVKNWGKSTSVSEIEVYEWIKSTLPPREFNEKNKKQERESFEPFPGEAVFLDNFNKTMEFDPDLGRLREYYYFWVKNREIPIKGKTISVKGLSDIIKDPSKSSKPWFAVIGENEVIVCDPTNIINNDDIVLQIWVSESNDKNLNNHLAWTLVQENNSSSFIPEKLWYKMRTSLCGFDDYGLRIDADASFIFKSYKQYCEKVIILNKGSGYTDGIYQLSLLGGNGLIQTSFEVKVEGGEVVSATILNSGLYIEPPQSPFVTTLPPGGSGAQFFFTFVYEKDPNDIDLALPVPDPNLSDSLKYGNSIRPRQSWFRDINKARKEFIKVLNDIFKNLLLYKDKPLWASFLNYFTPYPFDIQNPQSNQKIATSALDLYNKIINQQIVEGDFVLILGNIATKDFWTYWKFTNSGFELIDYQRENTTDLFEEIDYYESEDLENPTIFFQNKIEMYNNTLPEYLNKICRINDNDFGLWSWYRLEKNSQGNLYWKEVARQKGTIRFKDVFYTGTHEVIFNKNFVSFLYGKTPEEFQQNTPVWSPEILLNQNCLFGFSDYFANRRASRELKRIIEALRKNILTDEENNKLFFSMVKHAHVQNSFVDWSFKTSIVDIVGFTQEISEKPIVLFDITKSFSDYFDEIKPYHVKVKDLVKTYRYVDKSNFYVTDFDKMPFYDSNLEQFRPLKETDPSDVEILSQTNNPAPLFSFLLLSGFNNNVRQQKTFNILQQNQYVLTMDLSIIYPQLTEVKINGILKTLNQDYIINGNTIQFFIPLQFGDSVQVVEKRETLSAIDLVTKKNPWKDWYDNYLNNPELIRRVFTRILFDRISCIDKEILFSWDGFSWDDIFWDNQKTLTNPNIIQTYKIDLIGAQTIYDLENMNNIDPVLWSPANIDEIVYYFDQTGKEYKILESTEYELYYKESLMIKGDGSNNQFVIPTKQKNYPISSVKVYVDGVEKFFPADFSIIGQNILNFTTVPPANSQIIIKIKPTLKLLFSPLSGSYLKLKRYEESIERIIRNYVSLENKKSLFDKRLIPVCDFLGTKVEGGDFTNFFDWDFFDWDLPGTWDVATVMTEYYYDLIINGGLFYSEYEFTGNGIQTNFSLNPLPVVPPNILTNTFCVLNNTVLLIPGLDYTVTSNSVIFTTPPSNGSTIYFAIAPFLPHTNNPWDVIIDGYDFIMPQYGPGSPEELVKIKSKSSLMIKTTIEHSPGEISMENLKFVSDGQKTSYDFNLHPQSIESIKVFVDGILIIPPQWSLDYVNKKIVFQNPPPSGSFIEIIIYSWGGTAKKVKRWARQQTNFSSTSFTYPRTMTAIQSFATHNGNLIPGTITTINNVINNTTSWNVSLGGVYTGLIEINSFDVSNNEKVFLVRRDVFTASGGTQTFTLSQNVEFINLLNNLSPPVTVYRNGIKLKGPTIEYYGGDGTNRVFPLTYHMPNDPNLITVYVDGVLQVHGVDYVLGPYSIAWDEFFWDVVGWDENVYSAPYIYLIEFYPNSVPPKDSKVIIIVNNNHWYRFVSPNQVVFDDPDNVLDAGDEIVIYSISNYRDSKLIKTSFLGGDTPVYPLEQTPETLNHIEVYVDGKLQAYGSDYLIVAEAVGWEHYYWDMSEFVNLGSDYSMNILVQSLNGTLFSNQSTIQQLFDEFSWDLFQWDLDFFNILLNSTYIGWDIWSWIAYFDTFSFDNFFWDDFPWDQVTDDSSWGVLFVKWIDLPLYLGWNIFNLDEYIRHDITESIPDLDFFDDFDWDSELWDLFDYKNPWILNNKKSLVFKKFHSERIDFIGNGIQTDFSLAGLTSYPVESLAQQVTVLVNSDFQLRGVTYDLVYIGGIPHVQFFDPPNNGTLITVYSHARIDCLVYRGRLQKDEVVFLGYSDVSSLPNIISSDKPFNDWEFYKVEEENKLSLRNPLPYNSNILTVNNNKNLPVNWMSKNQIDQGNAYNPETGEILYDPALIIVDDEIVSYRNSSYDFINDSFVMEKLVRSIQRTGTGVEYRTFTAAYNGNGVQTIFALPTSFFFKVFAEIGIFEYNPLINDFELVGTKPLREGIDYFVATNTIVFNSPPPLNPSSIYPANIFVKTLHYDWLNSSVSHLPGVEVISLPKKNKFKTEYSINWSKNKGIQYDSSLFGKFLNS